MAENGMLNWDEQKAAYDRGYNSAGSEKTASTAEAYARDELSRAVVSAYQAHLASKTNEGLLTLEEVIDLADRKMKGEWSLTTDFVRAVAQAQLDHDYREMVNLLEQYCSYGSKKDWSEWSPETLIKFEIPLRVWQALQKGSSHWGEKYENR